MTEIGAGRASTVHALDDERVLRRVGAPEREARVMEHARAAARAAARDRLQGQALLRLDLHPENVLLSPAGPVMIDWTNARAGESDRERDSVRRLLR